MIDPRVQKLIVEHHKAGEAKLIAEHPTQRAEAMIRQNEVIAALIELEDYGVPGATAAIDALTSGA